MAAAQYKPPALENLPIGEKYHFEVAGNIWNPALTGQIASEQFGIAGTNIDFTKDLGFTQTRFRDLRIVLRPSKKQKLRIQYTPIDYISATTLSRNVVFNGINFNVALPIKADFGWNVWRFGYEWDFVYRPRGYVGLLLEGRLTKMSATLASPIDTEFTTVRAPLPAIGVVGRVYPTSNVAINFEVTRDVRAAECDRRGQPGLQAGARPEVSGLVLRLGHLRHDQLQQLHRRAGRLAPDDDPHRHQPGHWQSQVPGYLVRGCCSGTKWTAPLTH